MSALFEDMPAISITTKGHTMKEECFGGPSLGTLLRLPCVLPPSLSHRIPAGEVPVSLVCISYYSLVPCLILYMSVGLEDFWLLPHYLIKSLVFSEFFLNVDCVND